MNIENRFKKYESVVLDMIAEALTAYRASGEKGPFALNEIMVFTPEYFIYLGQIEKGYVGIVLYKNQETLGIEFLGKPGTVNIYQLL